MNPYSGLNISFRRECHIILFLFTRKHTNNLMFLMVLFLQTIYKSSHTKVWYKLNKIAADINM